LLCDLGLHRKDKSPFKAGVLSVIPGLGYWYTGHMRTAISALIVNGLFFLGTFEAFDNENIGLGTALSILSAGWYFGGIYGSMASAVRKNEYENSQLQASITIGVYF
jgi:hypothetical protein